MERPKVCAAAFDTEEINQILPFPGERDSKHHAGIFFRDSGIAVRCIEAHGGDTGLSRKKFRPCNAPVILGLFVHDYQIVRKRRGEP